MGKYLKKFDTHAEYNTYINGQDKILPNVSYCVDNNDVHYNPWIGLIIKFNVTSTSEVTKLTFNATTAAQFSEMWIDDVKQNNVVVSYTFATTGEHVVKYKLVDPTTIDVNSFNQCSNITSVILPNTLTTIGDAAFYYCINLASIRIPNSVTTIGDYAFTECSSLVNITIPKNITEIGEGVFKTCTNLTSVTIPNGVTSIGDQAFYECTSLTSLIIPNNVTEIGEFCFISCTSLTNVIIGNNVTYIGSSAFAGSSITSITIPSSVTNISQYAFRACSNLASVTVEATTPPILESNVFDNNASSRKIYVPSESVAAYKAASGWSTYASDIEAIQ